MKETPLSKAAEVPPEMVAASVGLNAMHPVVGRSLETATRLGSFIADLQKLQADALMAGGRSIGQAIVEAGKAGDFPTLLKAQARLITSWVEQASSFGQRSLALALASLPPESRPRTSQTSATRAAVSNGPPRDADTWLADPQAAWTQLAQQWVNVMTRGAIPG